jgi:hypothetical protein
MSVDRKVSILAAGRRRPGRGDADTYGGIQVTLVLDYLKDQPVVAVRLTDVQAAKLVQQLGAALVLQLSESRS